MLKLEAMRENMILIAAVVTSYASIYTNLMQYIAIKECLSGVKGLLD